MPYKAISPVTRHIIQFNTKSDLKEQIMLIYEESIEKKVLLGDSLYKQIPFFASDADLYDARIQSTIKGMRYCEASNTSPYPSLLKTPAK